MGGPIPWLIVAEMFDAKYVALAMSASCQVNWICNFLVGLLFPYMNKYLGPYSFVPFAIVLFLGFMFSAIWLPETQGTTPEELQAELVKKNSSTVYHNMSFVDDVIGAEGDATMNLGSYNYGFNPIDDRKPEVEQGNFLP